MTHRFTIVTSAFALSICVSSTASLAAGQSQITDTFCNTVQTSIMSNTVPAQTMVHPDYEAFVLSKAAIDPLRNEQFTTLGPDGAPRMISCKMKTPDHIQEFYGEDTVNAEARSCEAINRENIAAVLDSLTAEEQTARALSDEDILFGEDISVMTGTSWTAPFDFVTRTDDGKIQIQSKRMQVDWTNLLFKMAPERFRGALYCHLIAPEFAKALILGQADVPAPVEE